MDFEKKQKVRFAKGFIDSFIDEYYNSLPQGVPQHMTDQANQLVDMWNVIVTSLSELVEETDTQAERLEAIRRALI